MKKLTNMVLMLCFILSGAFCYANSTVGKGNEKDGRPVSIELKESTGSSIIWDTSTMKK